MELTAQPVPSPFAVLREEFDDWAVLYNPDNAEAVGLNPVGITIWKAVDGRRTVADILACVQDAYADVPGTAAADLSAFLDDLARRGFVGLAA